MCIIAAKPAGVKMPDDDVITRMWWRNNDGAGIMYAKDGKVRIDKGFMKLEDFRAHLAKVRRTVDLDSVAVVMHFRITTHGGTSPQNCHPFPITRSVKMLQALHQSAPMGVAHNGIIDITPRKGISDTMEYIVSQLAPLYDMNREFVKNKFAMELVKNAIGSKMAFLTGTGEIYLIGDFVEENGIKYSNTSFKPYEYTSNYFAGAYGAWSDIPFTYDKYFGEDSFSNIEELPLMWAGDLPEGSYYKIDGLPDMIDDLDDIMIDEQGRVYAYDWDDGLAYPCPDFRVFTPTGTPAKYDEKEASLEPVGYSYEDVSEWKRKPKASKGKKVTTFKAKTEVKKL